MKERICFYPLFLVLLLSLSILSCSDDKQELEPPGGKEPESPIVEEPKITIDNPILTIEFSADGEQSYSEGEEVPSTFKVGTNQETWDAVSDKSWCVVEKISGNTFKISVKKNTKMTTPEPATVTITSGDATPIVIQVNQRIPDPAISVSPELTEIKFSRDALTAFSGKEEVEPVFTVTTNQEFWDVISDQAWCTVQKNEDNGTFTVSVTENATYQYPAPAILTVSAGEAEPVTITVTQKRLPSIYQAGIIKKEEIAAAYWKDGTPFLLGDGISPSYANSIFVSGDDVYVGGYGLTTKKNYAVYWKNGVEYPIEDEYTALGEGIYVENGDVYLAGVDYISGARPVYWKNGEIVRLDAKSQGFAKSIYVEGDDVYLAGYESYHQYDIPVYWKNGKIVRLATESESFTANSIFVSGEDIYVCGEKRISNDKWIAVYWKNGELTQLGDGVNSSFATSIFVDENDVYISGRENIFDYAHRAVYWKNDQRTILSEGYLDCATSVFVYEGVPYFSGNRSLAAIYWKGHEQFKLQDGYNASSIFIGD